MSSPIDIVLGRLNGVARTGTAFKALCPVHGDKTPSLSIKEGDDGRVLLHCFGGCEIQEVVDALDLKMADLFVTKVGDRKASTIQGVTARELMAATDHEKYILYFVNADHQAGRSISNNDLERAKLALDRISKVRRAL